MECKKCNQEMIWQNDFSFEDIQIEGEGIVSYFYCPHCDKLYEALWDYSKDEVCLNECEELDYE